MNNLTIMDIAREAGVSKATVSRVINSSGAVSQKTKERVMGELLMPINFLPLLQRVIFLWVLHLQLVS